MKLLLIEDDHALVQSLRRALQPAYKVDAASTGEEGIAMADSNAYRVILLDVAPPAIDGLAVCHRLCKIVRDVPIIVLSGSDSVYEKIALLDAGADDYIVKPVTVDELKARIRAASRRGVGIARSSQLVIDDLMLDMATRTVTRAGQSIELRRKEFDLLEYLMHHTGQVVTRSMIIDHLWDSSETLWTNTVDVHIKHLRDKVDRPFGSQLIKTIHGVGYKIEPITKAVSPGSTTA